MLSKPKRDKILRNVWTIEEVKKELHRLDPVLEETDHAFYAGETLLSSLIVGADLRKLNRFTGLPMAPLW